MQENNTYFNNSVISFLYSEISNLTNIAYSSIYNTSINSNYTYISYPNGTININSTGIVYIVDGMNQTPNMTAGPQGPQGIQGVKGDKGDKGDTGSTGPAGASASIDVNDTFTGAPGTDAIVTNIGNTTNALLDFVIPRGEMNQTPNMTSYFVGSTWYDHNVTSSDIPGYFVFNRSFPTGIEGTASVQAMSAGTEYLIKAFVTNPGDPGLTYLPAGERVWTTYAKVSSTVGGDSYIVIRLYKRNLAGVETEMYNGTTEKLETSIDEAMASVTVPINQPMDITDRFVAKYYAKTTSAANPTITMYFDDNNHASRVTSPIIQGLQGPQGPAGTITINSTFTGEPGTNASVVNIGNSTQAVLDFTIPGSSSGTVNMSAIYPVGSVYISTTSTNPSVLFGIGTWVRIGEGRVLIGQDSNITYLNTSLSTGGNFTQNISAHTYGV